MATTKLSSERSECVFVDAKAPYTQGQAAAEAHRCLFCHDAPCIKACPTAIDIPGFIRKIATDNIKGSARTIFESNILGMSCARVCPVEVLCVGDCVYNEMGVPPIQIGKLQRFATDRAFEEGWEFFAAGADTGKSVGIIGAGPAGLACAHRLRRFGHRVTIYERGSTLGGLNASGVAPYKMKADRALQEVEWVLAIGGIEIKSGVDVPRDVAWTELERRHDALFFGLGLGEDRWMQIPGADLPGVIGATNWIAKMKLGRADVSAIKCAIVVGGGNTALDVVRELLGLGVPRVELCYRRSEAEMSGYAHEWSAAKDAGARARFGSVPVACVAGADGRLQAVTIRSGAGDETVPAELVVMAIGQARLGEVAAALAGVVIDGGRIVTDAVGATGRRGLYAGGDCANGGQEVVNATAEGRDAAVAIDRFLNQARA